MWLAPDRLTPVISCRAWLRPGFPSRGRIHRSGAGRGWRRSSPGQSRRACATRSFMAGVNRSGKTMVSSLKAGSWWRQTARARLKKTGRSPGTGTRRE